MTVWRLPAVPVVEPDELAAARAELRRAQAEHARIWWRYAGEGHSDVVQADQRAQFAREAVERLLAQLPARLVPANDPLAIVESLERSCTVGTLREVAALLVERYATRRKRGSA